MLLNPHTAVNSSAHTAGMVLIAGTVFAWALSLRLLSEALFAALGLWLSVWLSLGLGILGLLGLYKPPSSSKVSFAGSLQREASSGRTCVLLSLHHWDTRVPGFKASQGRHTCSAPAAVHRSRASRPKHSRLHSNSSSWIPLPHMEETKCMLNRYAHAC